MKPSTTTVGRKLRFPNPYLKKIKVSKPYLKKDLTEPLFMEKVHREGIFLFLEILEKLFIPNFFC